MRLSADSHHKNNFDTLRLAGAGLVLVSHGFALTHRPEPTVGGISLGGVGARPPGCSLSDARCD